VVTDELLTVVAHPTEALADMRARVAWAIATASD